MDSLHSNVLNVIFGTSCPVTLFSVFFKRSMGCHRESYSCSFEFDKEASHVTATSSFFALMLRANPFRVLSASSETL